jgi:hypothetical protein
MIKKEMKPSKMKILKSLLVIGVIAAMGVSATSAVFSSQYVNAGNSFSTGVLKITTDPANAFLLAENMMPGQGVIKTLTVWNNGTVDVNYRVKAFLQSGSEELFNALVITVKKDKEVLYTGSLSGLATNGTAFRPLAKNTGEQLTFELGLPRTATGPQGVKAWIGFTFEAVQQ